MLAKPLNVQLTPRAEADLEEVWLYTFQTWSVEQADRYINLLYDAFEEIAADPETGKDVSDIREHYRRHAAGRHFIFYRIHADHLSVIRILHQRRDFPRHL